jgi:uncharacterized Fe-S cluster-containing radical SAM superfamily protein
MSTHSDARQGYDPLKLGEAVQAHVVREDERKYYRFRGGKWYGGIATADCVGCNLRCVFCWGLEGKGQLQDIWRVLRARRCLQEACRYSIKEKL